MVINYEATKQILFEILKYCTDNNLSFSFSNDNDKNTTFDFDNEIVHVNINNNDAELNEILLLTFNKFKTNETKI